MRLIRVGHRTINLEYLIDAADSAIETETHEIPKGMIRVSVYPGKTFDVGGEAAATLRLHLDLNLESLPHLGDQRTKPRGARSRVVNSSPEKSTSKDE